MQLNFQYMPKDRITWRTGVTFRRSDVPYWSGSGGVTPPGGNNGSPGSFVRNNGSVIGADSCAGEGGIYYADLVTREVIWWNPGQVLPASGERQAAKPAPRGGRRIQRRRKSHFASRDVISYAPVF